MQERIRLVSLELAITVLATTAGVALLVSIHSHLWLAAAADTPAGELSLLYTDSVAAETSTTERLRLYGAIATVACLGLLAAVSTSHEALATRLRREGRQAAVTGTAVAAVGAIVYLLAPDFVLAALGLTLLAYGLLAAVPGLVSVLVPATG